MKKLLSNIAIYTTLAVAGTAYAGNGEADRELVDITGKLSNLEASDFMDLGNFIDRNGTPVFERGRQVGESYSVKTGGDVDAVAFEYSDVNKNGRFDNSDNLVVKYFDTQMALGFKDGELDMMSEGVDEKKATKYFRQVHDLTGLIVLKDRFGFAIEKIEESTDDLLIYD